MDNSEAKEAEIKGKGHGEKRLEVSVYTTSGSFPGNGHISMSSSDLVSEVLEKAKKALHLTDTASWVATVNGKPVNPAETFEQNHLTGTITIHWGPREGGGG